MILTRLAGGFGNQIFQLAAAMALRGEHEQRMFFDTQSLSQYAVKRDFELRRFFQTPRWFVTDVEAGWQGKVMSSAMQFRLGRFLPFVGVNDRNFAEHLRAKSEGRTQYLMMLDGYFQRDWSWPVFEGVRTELVRRLLPELTGSLSDENADCCIHIRGGDFLTTDNARIVDTDYYIRGVYALRQQMSVSLVRVITDDVCYAKSTLSPIGAIFPDLRIEYPDDHGNMVHDFVRLSRAKSRILGNSTFSWWAAALDPRAAVTYSPSKWNKGQERTLVLPWERIIAV